MSEFKLNRLPVLGACSINNSKQFSEIEFKGNNVFATAVIDEYEALLFIRRYEGLEFKDGLTLTDETRAHTFNRGLEGLDERDLCLSFKSSKNLKSFIDNLKILLEIQMKKESEVSND